MATTFVFGSKARKEPGSYSQIISGIKNPPQNFSFGNILIVDTGAGAGYGIGAGIAGTLASKKEAIYSFDNLEDFRQSVRGGINWLLAGPLFQPNGFAFPGVSKIYFVSAKTSAPAEISYTFTGDTDESDSGPGVNGGTLTVQVRNEGLVGNGVQISGVLTRGCAGRMRAGTSDTTKFVIDFYAGTFKGLDLDGQPFDFIAEVDTIPQLIISSPEFGNISDLITWMKNDFTFNQSFKLKTSTVTGDGSVTVKDLTANAGNKLASGGTETYSSANLDTILANISDLDYTFILADKYGDNAQHAYNVKLVSHVTTEARYDKFVVIGGGKNRDKFVGSGSSIESAVFYDTDKAIIVHAGAKKTKLGGGFKEYDSNYKAAAVLGRICGLQPQVPATFKAIAIDGDLHDMNEAERILALDKGVLHTKFDTEFNAFIINEGINTLQKNTNVLNEDGMSHLISLKRIAAQLNKEIVINAKLQLLGQTNGVNRNTLSALDVKQWLEGFLTLKTATDSQDNLILSFQNITVEIKQDAYFVRYSFIPNGEITKLFFTGVIIG